MPDDVVLVSHTHFEDVLLLLQGVGQGEDLSAKGGSELKGDV